MMENVTLDHKTSHKGQFSKIEIYTMYCWLFATNIPQWLMTGFVVQVPKFQFWVNFLFNNMLHFDYKRDDLQN